DGRTKDAIKLLEHVIKVHKMTLNEGHLNRLTSQHVLTGAYQADSQTKDAIKLLKHIIKV
ncbi:hypothetical protein LY78DRAFT_562273, partial [Colletotrichum sublineola]